MFDGADFLYHKRKNGSVQWIFSNYAIHYLCRENIGLGILRDVSFKQAHEHPNDVLFYVRGGDPIKGNGHFSFIISNTNLKINLLIQINNLNFFVFLPSVSIF